MSRVRRNSSDLNRRYSLISVGTVLLVIAIFAVVQSVLMDDIYLAFVKSLFCYVRVFHIIYYIFFAYIFCST